MEFCLEAWCSMDNSLNTITVNYIATFCDSMNKKTTPVGKLRLLFSHQIKNSRYSLCKISKSTSVFRLDFKLITNKLENPVSRKVCCWTFKKALQCYPMVLGDLYKGRSIPIVGFCPLSCNAEISETAYN